MNEVAIQEHHYDMTSSAMDVKNVTKQIQLIQAVMKEAMKENEHYGIIPGCQKPSLYKPGAEKLSLTFRLSPTYEITDIPLPNAHREYRVICTITHIPTSAIFGQGVGSCSTMEGKFRFRNEERKCPLCGATAIIKGKKEYGGGWLCWKQKGGCGEKFKDDESTIIDQPQGKVEHDNPADYYNCVTPDTKVLTHDLQWIPAGEIETGDRLIGVEENMTSEYARHFAIGEAIVGGSKVDDLFEITLEDGRSVKCNGEHQWLVKKIGLKGTEWARTQDIYQEIVERKGRPRSWSVMSVCVPWVEERTKEAGYLAGLLDADGSLGISQLCVVFAQQANNVLALFQHGLAERGYQLGVSHIKTEEMVEQSRSQKQVFHIRVTGGFTEQLRLLGSIRPPRLMERWLNMVDLENRRLEGRGSGAGKQMRIISIQPVGKGEIILLGTSCKTYIAEGLVCHNTCLKMAKKRAHVDAILTVTAASDIFTQDLEDMGEVLPTAAEPKTENKESKKETKDKGTMYLAELKRTFKEYAPGQSEKEKKAKIELIKNLFNTDKWENVEKSSWMILKQGVERLHVIVKVPENTIDNVSAGKILIPPDDIA